MKMVLADRLGVTGARECAQSPVLSFRQGPIRCQKSATSVLLPSANLTGSVALPRAQHLTPPLVGCSLAWHPKRRINLATQLRSSFPALQRPGLFGVVQDFLYQVRPFSTVLALQEAFIPSPSRISKHEALGQVSHVQVKASRVSIYDAKRLLRASHHQGIRDYFRSDAGSWLILHTYAASADAWSGVSCAPPIGGMGLRYCFGCDTPFTMVFLIPAKLPSLHSHFFPFRAGPKGVPSPLSPWHPTQGAPPTCPW